MAKMCFRPVPLFKLCVTISRVLVSRESLQWQRDFPAVNDCLLYFFLSVPLAQKVVYIDRH